MSRVLRGCELCRGNSCSCPIPKSTASRRRKDTVHIRLNDVGLGCGGTSDEEYCEIPVRCLMDWYSDDDGIWFPMVEEYGLPFRNKAQAARYDVWLQVGVPDY